MTSYIEFWLAKIVVDVLIFIGFVALLIAIGVVAAIKDMRRKGAKDDPVPRR